MIDITEKNVEIKLFNLSYGIDCVDDSYKYFASYVYDDNKGTKIVYEVKTETPCAFYPVSTFNELLKIGPVRARVSAVIDYSGE